MKNKNKKRGFADDVELVPILVLDSPQPLGLGSGGPNPSGLLPLPLGPEEQLYAVDPLTETRQDFINRVWCDYYNHPPYVNTGLAKYEGKDFSFFSKEENVTDEEFEIAQQYCTAKTEMDKLKLVNLKTLGQGDVFYPIDPLPYDDMILGLGSGGPGPRLGYEELHPVDMLEDSILGSSTLPENSDVASGEPVVDMQKVVSPITPPQPIAPTEQTMDETMTPVGTQPLSLSSFSIDNISDELVSKSPIAQAAADKLATMQLAAPTEETKKAEIKVSKNLNPYVIALGVVVGLLIIDKLIMKDAAGN